MTGVLLSNTDRYCRQKCSLHFGELEGRETEMTRGRVIYRLIAWNDAVTGTELGSDDHRARTELNWTDL